MPISPHDEEPSGNRLLDSLPDDERTRLVDMMSLAPIKPHDMLVPPGQAMRKVYFPTSGVISLMTPLEDGGASEAGTVGDEGVVGGRGFFVGACLGPVQAMSQVPGEILTMDIDHFRAEASAAG